MALNDDKDINDHEPVTPTHVKVEIIPDDGEVNTEPQVAIDTEDAKAVDLKLTFANMLQLQHTEYAYAKHLWYEITRREHKQKYRTLRKDVNNIQATVDLAARIDAYHDVVAKCGISKSLASVIDYTCPVNTGVTLSMLPAEGDPQSHETKTTLHSLEQYVPKIQQCLDTPVAGIRSSMEEMKSSLVDECRYTTRHIDTLADRLRNSTLNEKAASKYRCSLLPVQEWSTLATDLVRVAAPRELYVYLQHVTEISSVRNDYFTAVTENLTCYNFIPTFVRRCMSHTSPHRWEKIGVDLSLPIGHNVNEQYVADHMEYSIDTLEGHGWSKNWEYHANDDDMLLRHVRTVHTLNKHMLKLTDVYTTLDTYLDRARTVTTHSDVFKMQVAAASLELLQPIIRHVHTLGTQCIKAWTDAALITLQCCTTHV